MTTATDKSSSTYVIDRSAGGNKNLVYNPNQLKAELDAANRNEFGHSGSTGMVLDLVSNWPNNDVWPMKFSLPLTFFSCAASGFYMNKIVRDSLLLMNTGRIASALSLITVPGILAGGFHLVFVTSNIIQQTTPCPVCVQMRSAAIQIVFGLAYPLFMAPVANYTFAARMKDVHIPNVIKEPSTMWNYTKSMFKPFKGHLMGLAAAQMVIGMGLAYLEQDCYYSTILPVLEGKTTFVRPKPLPQRSPVIKET